jgi:alkylation response protein AidB-like acyl-CoA dehydrogenase
MGGRETNDVFFADARVPAENVVGSEGQGWIQLMAGLNVERLIIAAQHLGMAEAAFDDLLAYVKEREQFGRPIGSFQALKHRIADLATELECCRLLVYDVARKVDEDPNRMLPREASMAKLKCTEVNKAVALEGMQMMGGYGYASEYAMEGHVRRAVVGTIYGGTSEIQREIIGKTLGL